MMKDFEGIKRINNEKNLDLIFLYKLLSKYEDKIGSIDLEEDIININVNGKYVILVYINSQNQIIIEKKIEINEVEIKKQSDEAQLKSVDESIADRMIEQIYDMIISLDEENKENEIITGVNKILFACQEITFMKNCFHITDENKREIYQIKENKLLKQFRIENLITTRKNVVLKFTGSELGKYIIEKNLYNVIRINRDNSGTKLKFLGQMDNKDLVITADYSSNHYIIELKGIVIGAIDALEVTERKNYRIEINNTDYEDVILAILVIIDLNFEN